MIIGRMTEHITLLEPVDVDDGQGGRVREYKEVAKVWAEIKRPSARDIIATGTPASELMREISIRKFDKLRRGWHILHNHSEYEVCHVFSYDLSSTCILAKEVSV